MRLAFLLNDLCAAFVRDCNLAIADGATTKRSSISPGSTDATTRPPSVLSVAGSRPPGFSGSTGTALSGASTVLETPLPMSNVCATRSPSPKTRSTPMTRAALPAAKGTATSRGSPW